MTETEQCSVCRYARDVNPELGEYTCRRTSPTWQGWPTVYSRDWCGEFEHFPVPMPAEKELGAVLGSQAPSYLATLHGREPMTAHAHVDPSLGQETCVLLPVAGPSPADVMGCWNTCTAPPLPRVYRMTAGRRAKVKTRLETIPDLADWRTIFEWVDSQPWCRGETERKWVIDLDWLIHSDERMQKMLERANAPEPHGAPDPADKLADAASEFVESLDDDEALLLANAWGLKK